MADTLDDRSVRDLVSDLADDIRTLVRSEFELVRNELSHRIARVPTRLAAVVAGLVLALAGLYAIVAGLVLAVIAWGVPAWAAAFLVGALLAATGVIVASLAIRALRREDLVPRASVKSFKETVQWAKRQATP